MKISPLPANESERLETIKRYQIMDTEDEEDFDDLVELASHLCDTPIALITLIDKNRQWFKAKTGLTIKETHRDLSFCAHAIHHDDVMVIGDTLLDDRFSDNPLVTGDPYIRFYAGMPLIGRTGHKLGTLAVIDRKPRNLNDQQLGHLRILGKQVMNLLDLRCTVAELQKTNNEIACLVAEKTTEIREVFERVSDAFIAVDKNWQVTYINKRAAEITGRTRHQIIGKNLWNTFPEAFSSDFPKLANTAMDTQTHQHEEAYFPPYNRWLETHIYPSPTGISVYFRDITERKKIEERLVESESRLRAIIQTEPECIKLLGANCELLEMNPAGLAMIEADSLDQVVNHSVLELVVPEHRDAFTKLVHGVFKGAPGMLEFEMISLKGSHRWVETYAVPLKNSNGEIVSLLAVARDTTERKMYELSLREAKERYRNIFENATEGIYQTNPAGQFITANPSMAKMFGYESADDLIHSVTNVGDELYADPQDRSRVKLLLEKHGYVTGLELKLVKKNKEIIWARVNDRVVRGYNGEIEYFEGSVEDITQRKEAEEKLILQKRLDQIMVRAQALFITSEDSRDAFDILLNDLLSITQSEYGFIGEVLHDAKGQPYLKTHTITDISWNEETRTFYGENIRDGLVFDNLKTLFGEVMVTGKPVIANSPASDTRRGDLPDGHPALTAFLGLPFGSEDGKMKGMLGLSNRPGGYDEGVIEFLSPLVKMITHLVKAAQNEKTRRQTEIALRNSENKLKAFFRSTPDASVLLGRNFEILAFNSAANELVLNTYGREIVEGEIYTDLIFTEVRPLITQFLTKALNGETSQGEFPVPNITTGKSVWWLVVFMPAYDKDGAIFGIISNATNINEIKRAEQRLQRQFQELQKTNNELDKFVYSVSHDLRAPLASILGLINIAELENIPSSQKNYLEMIRGSVNRLDGFINDILDYSRNSRLTVLAEVVYFNKLVSRAQTNIMGTPGHERLKIEVNINNDVPFFSDPARIEIIFNNLFSNSIKYQDYQKDSSSISICIETTPENALIRFSDNGIGIESSHLGKIFDMFYRASENSKGSGLGLYIARETIAKLGGSIKVESEFGEFTKFEIIIPNVLPVKEQR
jgi:PAS domain S-box-containing protein